MIHFRQLKSVLLAGIGVLASAALFAQTVFEAKLTGAQQPTPVLTKASGLVTAVLNGNNLEVSGTFNNLSSAVDVNIAGGAHLHIGLLGESGPVAHVLTSTLNTAMDGGSFAAASNSFTLTNAEVTALENREIYINIHTLSNQGGELRGQLVPAGNSVYTMQLFGSNEVPSIITDASGQLLLDVDPSNNLTVTGSFANLEGDYDASIAGGAHLHNGLSGENGPVEVLLNSDVDMGLRSGRFVADRTLLRLQQIK